MPYIVRNIDVLDIKPSTGIGISVPFDGSTGINTTFTTKDTVKSNLLNFIRGGVESYFPTVDIQDLEVTLKPDDLRIEIYLSYTIINTNIEDEIQINLSNGGI
jgi:hypothetical protein